MTILLRPTALVLTQMPHICDFGVTTNPPLHSRHILLPQCHPSVRFCATPRKLAQDFLVRYFELLPSCSSPLCHHFDFTHESTESTFIIFAYRSHETAPLSGRQRIHLSNTGSPWPTYTLISPRLLFPCRPLSSFGHPLPLIGSRRTSGYVIPLVQSVGWVRNELFNLPGLTITITPRSACGFLLPCRVWLPKNY